MPDKIAQKDFLLIPGKIPILISAPHSHAHFRPNLNMTYKSGEPWSDSMVQALAHRTGAHGIHSVGSLDYDPNYDALGKNEYKAEVAALIRQMKIKYYFDLHGLSDSHEYDFAIFYALRFSKSKKLASLFAEAVTKGDLRGASIQMFNLPSGEQETLTEFVVRRLRIPALQIEIARYIREDEKLRASLIENMSSLIGSLNL